MEENQDWYFVEQLPLDEDLTVGMQTQQEVWEQVEKDISRINIDLNGVRITEAGTLFSKVGRNLSIMRHCTQSVFFRPLERLTLLFPDYILTHPRPDIFVHVKKHVCTNWFCKYFYDTHSSAVDFNISTMFRAVDPKLFENRFDIRWNMSFAHGEEKGILSYKLYKLV